MAKEKPKQQKRALKPKPKPRPVKAGLDPYATAYAKLVANPCHAQLTKGIGTGSAASVVMRFEADQLAFTGGTVNGGTLFWVPGSATGFSAGATADSSALTMAVDTSFCAGRQFLDSSCSAARCIAACMQVYYPGSELNRSGIVALGVMPVGSLTGALPATYGGSGGLATNSQYRPMCQFSERTPETMMEITWRPGSGDEGMVDRVGLAANLTSFPVALKGSNGILLNATGLAAGVGLRIRTVAVYELEFNAGNGLVNTVETSRSANSVNDVLRTLDNVMPNWFINGFKTAATTALRLGASYVTGGASEAFIQQVKYATKPTPARLAYT